MTLGTDSKSENGEGVHELGRKASVEMGSVSSCAGLGLGGKERQKEWLTDSASGSDDAVERRWVKARWSGQ